MLQAKKQHYLFFLKKPKQIQETKNKVLCFTICSFSFV